jgi:hypothetical protein
MRPELTTFGFGDVRSSRRIVARTPHNGLAHLIKGREGARSVEDGLPGCCSKLPRWTSWVQRFRDANAGVPKVLRTMG